MTRRRRRRVHRRRRRRRRHCRRRRLCRRRRRLGRLIEAVLGQRVVPVPVAPLPERGLRLLELLLQRLVDGSQILHLVLEVSCLGLELGLC